MRRKIRVGWAVLSLLLSSVGASDAQNNFLPEGEEGDWFDSRLWSIGEAPIYVPLVFGGPQPPAAAQRIRISDGGTAVARAGSPLTDGLGFVGAAGLQVGSQVWPVPDYPNSPSGRIRVEGLDLISNWARVGSDELGGRDLGDFSTFGEISVDQDFRIIEFLSIGSSSSQNANPTGHVSVGGDLIRVGQADRASISIGAASPRMAAPELAPQSQGSLVVGGDVQDFSIITIGIGNLPGMPQIPGSPGGVSTAQLDVEGDVLTRVDPPPMPGVPPILGAREGPGLALIATGSGTLNADVVVGGHFRAITQIAYSDQAQANARVRIGGDLVGGIEAGTAVRGGDATADVEIGGRIEAHGQILLGRADADSSASATVASGSVSYVPVAPEPFAPIPPPPNVIVGESLGGGDASGRFVVTGDLLDFEDVIVGRTVGEGAASGELEIHDGRVRADRLLIAPDAELTGLGSGLGRVILDNSSVEVDALQIGSGGSIEIRLGISAASPPGPGINLTSVISTSTSVLSGALRLVLDESFASLGGESVIDLLRAAGADGIEGDFSSIVIAGLDPSQVRLVQEVVVDAGGTVFERLRAYVIPEPSTGILLVLGLAALSRTRDSSLMF